MTRLRRLLADLAAGWAEHFQGEPIEYHADGPVGKLEIVLTHYDNDTVDFQFRSLKRGWKYRDEDVTKVLLAVAYSLAPPPGVRVVPTEVGAQHHAFHPEHQRAHALAG